MATSTRTKLVIVESPAKAKTIEKFLGRGYKVEASQGHVRDLPKSQIGVDPAKDFEMKYITIRGKGDVLAKLRKEVKKADKVYLATDPDREGEIISWHLKEELEIPEEKYDRVTFREITKDVVLNSINEKAKIDGPILVCLSSAFSSSNFVYSLSERIKRNKFSAVER